MLNKKLLQIGLNESVKMGEFSELYGKQVMELIDLILLKKNSRKLYGAFEVEYILRETMLFAMLRRSLLKYNEETTTAYSFLSLRLSSALIDGIRKVHAFKYGNEQVAFNSDDALYESVVDDVGDDFSYSELVILKTKKKLTIVR